MEFLHSAKKEYNLVAAFIYLNRLSFHCSRKTAVILGEYLFKYFSSLLVSDFDLGQCFPLQQKKAHTLHFYIFQFHLLLHLMRLLLQWPQVQLHWVLWMVLEH